jgi:hypothetical protein
MNMNTKTLLLLVAMSLSFLAYANDENPELIKKDTLNSKGFNYVSFGLGLGPTLNYYSSEYPVHYGLPVKVYLGRKKKGRFIIRTGIHYFPLPTKELFPGMRSIRTTIIPLAFGYRKNIKNWYVEGSLGAALNSYSQKFNDQINSDYRINLIEINYGLEVGRQIGDFDLGLAVYNTGPIPFNMLYAGIKGSYRIKW